MPDLCRAGVLGSRRGGEGGYWLARPASEITLADVVRAIEQPSTRARQAVPGATSDGQPAGHLGGLWTSVQEGLQSVLESLSLLDVVNWERPAAVVP